MATGATMFDKLIRHARIVGAAFALLTAGALVTPEVATAQQPASQNDAGKVQIDVMVVHATNNGRVDPRLRDLQRQLDQMRFTGFEVLSTSSDSLAEGQVTTVSVAGGRKVKVRLIEKDNRQARVRIELYKGSEKKLDTTVTIPRDRTFLVGGPKFDEGVLIFPITVEY
jgi:hypothetical protein